MGPTGIEEIKSHEFFRDIDWEAVRAKVPQPGRRKMPIEVNILESNFDRQYTRLPIKIDVAQEELIKIKDPIEPKKQVRKRSGSYTFRPHMRQRRRKRRNSSLVKRQTFYQSRAKLLHR